MKIPTISIPITQIPLQKNIQLFLKREDLIHTHISGNKYWKLFYNINSYIDQNPANLFIITFGGAFSNHIAAVAALGKEFQLKTLGIIRGDELQDKWQENPTLKLAHQNGMDFRFVSREEYKNKEKLTQILEKEFPHALIIPEGGTNKDAVEGIKFMLTEETKRFDYLCSAVGTGGTIAGISKFAKENQKILGFKVVDDQSLYNKVSELSTKNNFELIEAHDGKYGKITDENIRFINDFKQKYRIQLDPIYTGKMMKKLFELIEEDYFPAGTKILAFHTGGLQGISGANELLKKQNRRLIDIN
ncbi:MULTISPECIES: 1-aminocyclopropane-1-carboxylate deaminase/D-cysteine desulfhydrase [unclassified Kaistella]|uniref:1-aminocyclopropane-1-carboxylate deaminase/D-cysteine desulfhydrase n=1 Tax=unclassified Kaistella TaxID=2762626 RepID=UPI002734CBB6|nr:MULTISPECIES: pyridoxal-phosphate dependent enzyme [unclassified Kaistella]MDP2453749.1 pyridoxal-phosphate dependent enzyme [Kaistella sp. SH11-4b]MDP2456806.1 pyridoxal-phosphate dependent enzyme [Kaistella sp. SH40-3]MDP2459562.1 pyridoxal-phosphate dependent enzyme [Kaistella sp. SH19-2b]